MPDLEFYEPPDFWLNKKLEAMDNDEFPILGNLSNNSDCEYKDIFNYYSEIDVKNLMKDLRSSFHFKNYKFDAENYIIKKNYREETLKNSEAIKDQIGGIREELRFNTPKLSIDGLSKEIENLYYQLLSKSIALNTTKCYLDNRIGINDFEIDIDF
jgi:hypothetical protein